MVGEVSARRVEELRTDQPRIATGLCQLLLDCPLVTAAEELAPVEGMLTDLVNGELHTNSRRRSPRLAEAEHVSSVN